MQCAAGDGAGTVELRLGPDAGAGGQLDYEQRLQLCEDADGGDAVGIAAADGVSGGRAGGAIEAGCADHPGQGRAGRDAADLLLWDWEFRYARGPADAAECTAGFDQSRAGGVLCGDSGDGSAEQRDGVHDVGLQPDLPAELEHRERPCVGLAPHRAGRRGEWWTGVWDVADAGAEWAGRFRDERAVGTDDGQRAVRGYAGVVVRSERGADADDLSEYRKLRDGEPRVRIESGRCGRCIT